MLIVAKYLITGGFTYTDANGLVRYVDRGNWACDPLPIRSAPGQFPVYANPYFLDTVDPEWALPPDWQPPPIGLEATDAEALAALTQVRAQHVGKVETGLGKVPPARIVDPDGYFNPTTATGIGDT